LDRPVTLLFFVVLALKDVLSLSQVSHQVRALIVTPLGQLKIGKAKPLQQMQAAIFEGHTFGNVVFHGLLLLWASARASLRPSMITRFAAGWPGLSLRSPGISFATKLTANEVFPFTRVNFVSKRNLASVEA
jgi:hypothetical protein